MAHVSDSPLPGVQISGGRKQTNDSGHSHGRGIIRKAWKNWHCETRSLYIHWGRDGSYGLLRRPIRINTPLIRHAYNTQTYFCYFGGYPGLAPTTPQPPPNCPPSLQNIIMPPGKGPEWHHVVVMGPKGQIYEMPMPDARCQDSEILQRCPPHPQALHEAESRRRCSSMQS